MGSHQDVVPSPAECPPSRLDSSPQGHPKYHTYAEISPIEHHHIYNKGL